MGSFEERRSICITFARSHGISERLVSDELLMLLPMRAVAELIVLQDPPPKLIGDIMAEAEEIRRLAREDLSQ